MNVAPLALRPLSPLQTTLLPDECGINNAVCLAFSSDGLRWVKPRLQPDGSNIVERQPHDGSSVLLDHAEPDPSARFKMIVSAVQFCPEAKTPSERTNQTYEHSSLAPSSGASKPCCTGASLGSVTRVETAAVETAAVVVRRARRCYSCCRHLA